MKPPALKESLPPCFHGSPSGPPPGPGPGSASGPGALAPADSKSPATPPIGSGLSAVPAGPPQPICPSGASGSQPPEKPAADSASCIAENSAVVTSNPTRALAAALNALGSCD